MSASAAQQQWAAANAIADRAAYAHDPQKTRALNDARPWKAEY